MYMYIVDVPNYQGTHTYYIPWHPSPHPKPSVMMHCCAACINLNYTCACCVFSFPSGSSTLPEALRKFSRPWTPVQYNKSKTVRVRSADSGKVRECKMHVL